MVALRGRRQAVPAPIYCAVCLAAGTAAKQTAQ